MTNSDLIDLIMRSSVNPTISTTPRIVNNATARKAIQIMQDLQERKIKLLRAINPVEVQVIQDLSVLSHRYDRYKNYMSFPDYIARTIVATYNQAVMLGMIDDGGDSEKEALKQKITDLEKKVIRLQEQLGIQEAIDNPPVDFTSDLEEKDD